MEFNSKSLTAADSKIIMLYILSKPKKKISYKVYLELVTSLSDINYFDFNELLTDLCNDNFVKETLIDTEEEQIKYYELTEEGIKTLDLTIGMLAGIIKLRIDSNFIRDYKVIRNHYSVTAEYIPSKSIVVCKALDDERDIIKIELLIKNEEEAKTIVRNWNDKASKLYIDILELLSKKDDNAN